MSKNLITSTLQEIAFLHDMAPEYVEQIANISQVRDFDEFDVVFRDGELAEQLYLIISGNVHVEAPVGGGHYKHILTLGPGELLGWSSLLGESYTTRSTTPDSARLLEINVKPLMQLCNRDPEFGFEFMSRTTAALARRLSTTRGQLLECKGMSWRQRQINVFDNVARLVRKNACSNPAGLLSYFATAELRQLLATSPGRMRPNGIHGHRGYH